MSKNKGFFLRFNWLLSLLLARRTRLARGTAHAMIHHCKAMVGSLGVEVITKTKLVGQFVPERSVVVTVGTAEHESSKEFFTHILVGNGQLDVSRLRRIYAEICRVHVMELLCDEHRRYPNRTQTPVGLDGPDMRHKLTMVGAVVHCPFRPVERR
jgi:hypothetical protein